MAITKKKLKEFHSRSEYRNYFAIVFNWELEKYFELNFLAFYSLK